MTKGSSENTFFRRPFWVPLKSIGCKTVWLKGESWSADEPGQGVADRVITSLKELNA